MLKALGTVVGLALVFSGCSMDVPRHDGGRLKIVLDEPANVAAFAESLAPYSLLASTPSVTSDFNCFTVNVTGTGVLTNNLLPGSCQTTDNLHGRGPGMMAEPVQRGQTLEVDVPTGPARQIEVFGIYPSIRSCGGVGGRATSGYFLGAATKDLATDAAVTVVVPVSYVSGVSTASFNCTESSGSGATFKTFVYTANNTGNSVSVFQMDEGTGSLNQLALTAMARPEAAHVLVAGAPFGLAATPDKKFLYVTDNLGGKVLVNSIDQTTGLLTSLGSTPVGSGPLGAAVDNLGKFLYVANFSSDSISVLAINPSTGALTLNSTTNPGVGTSPHGIAVHPTSAFVYATFAGAGNYAVQPYSYNTSTGALATVGSTITTNISQPGDLFFDPLGKYLIVPNNTGGNVNMLVVNSGTGAATEAAGSPYTVGTNPASTTVDPTGKLACASNNNGGGAGSVHCFTINRGGDTMAGVPGSPNSTGTGSRHLAFDPQGKFLVVADQNSNTLSVFSVSPSTGALTPVTGSPFSSPGAPVWVTILRIQQP